MRYGAPNEAVLPEAGGKKGAVAAALWALLGPDLSVFPQFHFDQSNQVQRRRQMSNRRPEVIELLLSHTPYLSMTTDMRRVLRADEELMA